MNTPASLLDRVRVVLVHTTHPGNIGAAARAMKTMGLSRLYLINPSHFPDADADARASGANDVLDQAQVCSTLDEALHGAVLAVGVSARRRDLSHRMLSPREAAPLMLEQTAAGDVALVFGTEMSGLSNDELGRCQLLTSIPANPAYSSLNLASAVQVLAYELRLAAPGGDALPLPFERDPASLEDVERFYVHLEQVLVASEFLDPVYPGRMMQRLRRLFARASLEKEEINILRGILTALTPRKK